MELNDARVVITGGGSGIGRAMATRFAAAGALVTVADLNGDAASAVAASISDAGGRSLAVASDVCDETQVRDLVAQARQEFGPIDLMCSNAGIALGGGPEAPDADWTKSWELHVMSHVYAARAVIPEMLERRTGYILNTASAAGLLTNIGAAPYAVTKHAAVAFAEWLAVTYGDAGLRVSCLCPQGVNTPLLNAGLDEAAGRAVKASGDVIEPEDVAEVVVQGLADERFLILPHPIVKDYLQGKVADYDRWITGMQRLQARVGGRP